VGAPASSPASGDRADQRPGFAAALRRPTGSALGDEHISMWSCKPTPLDR
jgi:hypothetical protein